VQTHNNKLDLLAAPLSPLCAPGLLAQPLALELDRGRYWLQALCAA